MNLTPDQLQENFNKLIGYIEQHITGERKEKLLKLYNDHADRIDCNDFQQVIRVRKPAQCESGQCHGQQVEQRIETRGRQMKQCGEVPRRCRLTQGKESTGEHQLVQPAQQQESEEPVGAGCAFLLF